MTADMDFAFVRNLRKGHATSVIKREYQPYAWFDFSDLRYQRWDASNNLQTMYSKMEDGIHVVKANTGAPSGIAPQVTTRKHNGLWVADFAGGGGVSGGSRLDPGTVPISVDLNRGYTFFVVAVEDTDFNGNEGLLSVVSTGHDDWQGVDCMQCSWPSTGGQILVQGGGTSSQTAALSTATSPTTPALYSGRKNGTALDIWVGAGANSGSATCTGMTGTATFGFVIGGRYLPTLGSGSQFDGFIGDVIFMRYPMGDRAIAGMWKIIQDKWQV